MLKGLLKVAVDHALRYGADYAEARYQNRTTENVAVKNGAVEVANRGYDKGFGVRVLYGGSWGFACSSILNEAEMRRTAARALAIAKAAATVPHPEMRLDCLAAYVDRYTNYYRIHPLQVPIERKVELLLAATDAMRVDDAIKVVHGSVLSMETEKIFVSSLGSEIEQHIVECGGGIAATAVGNGEMQTRSYPNSSRGNHFSRGWEAIEEQEFEKHAAECGRQAVELLHAEECPADEMDLVIAGNQLYLQIHESCGHAVELDRVLGQEASFAGTSFLTPEKRGSFLYGSPIVNIFGDATIPGALGSFGYDDEGVPAQRFDIVKDGVFVGYLSTQDTSYVYDGNSHGAARAQSWCDFPICRMTNVSLAPGDATLDELIHGVKRGLFLETNKSWSIDDKRLNFQFGVEYARKIEDGKLGATVKNAVYAGKTPEFWGSCDGIADASHWQMWGTPNCGKGEPMQVMRVGHGTSPARFRRVKVGVAK